MKRTFREINQQIREQMKETRNNIEILRKTRQKKILKKMSSFHFYCFYLVEVLVIVALRRTNSQTISNKLDGRRHI